jgi:hypothetical protein
MTTWPADDLTTIAATDDLHIAPLREDGVTYGTPTWIWSVVVDSELYVRAYNGTRSSWYQAARAQQAGRITAAGKEHEVDFDALDGPDSSRDDAVDAAYRAKYASSPYLEPMLSERVKAATVRITPREEAGATPLEQSMQRSVRS